MWKGEETSGDEKQRQNICVKYKNEKTSSITTNATQKNMTLRDELSNIPKQGLHPIINSSSVTFDSETSISGGVGDST